MTGETKLRGITLTHPWSYAVARWSKDVENRSWRPESRGGQIGMYLAIHGGAVPGPSSGKREEMRLDLAAALQMAGRVPEVGVRGLLALEKGQRVEGEERYILPGIVAVARLAGVTQGSTSPWAARGQYHWQLADVVTLPEPVPHRGAQGLWALDEDKLQTVRGLYRAGLKAQRSTTNTTQEQGQRQVQP